jgi:metal transporter CNNM
MDYVVVVLLVLLSGIFSGLNLGLLSLDVHDLKRKISLGNKDAIRVYGVRKRGNLLLCTLLLGNVGANAALALFLEDIAGGLIAGISATGLIVVFGEIIPQATFARYALKIGANTNWLVKFFIVILFPICGPIAWMLDKILGDELPTVYSKNELMKIVEEHEGSHKSDVDADEERIIKGALSYSNKRVERIMTPRTVVFALPLSTILDSAALDTIKKSGFTRIPVYKDTIDDMVGVLYTKDLINIKLNISLSKVYKKEKLLVITKDFGLDKLLNMFIKSKQHIAFVEDQYHGLDGVVTLEDIIEEILRIEIVDETDKVVDLQELAREESSI